MRKVPVNWVDLEIAFERNSPEIESYLDLTSGEVVSIVIGEADAEDKQARVRAHSTDFLRIDSVSSREQYQWMERFVATVEDEALRKRLVISIDGRGAFRRFKDVLLSYPVERERWFTFRGGLIHYHIQQWLDQLKIEPANPSPWGPVEPPELPEIAPKPEPTLREPPGEFLRRQARELIDAIPAVELPSAIAFLDFLRERGLASLLGSSRRNRAKSPPAPASEVAAARARASGGNAGKGGPLSSAEDSPEELELEDSAGHSIEH